MPCEQLGYTPDDDDESKSELIPVTSPNLEEAVVTSLLGSSDVQRKLKEGSLRLSVKQGLQDWIYPQVGIDLRGIPVAVIHR